MSYSSRYTSSYSSSRYGDSSSRYGDSIGRCGGDSMKDYSSSRYGDYSSRYTSKDLNSDYSRTRGTLYSSRRLQTFDATDDDYQDVKEEKVDLDSIENAKYLGEPEKPDMIDDKEQNEKSIVMEGADEANDQEDEEERVLSLTPGIQDEEGPEEAEEVKEVEEVTQTQILSGSSVSLTQAVTEQESLASSYQKPITKEKYLPPASESTRAPITKTFMDESIPRKKVSDLIARYNAKCEMENSRGDGWKQKHEFGSRTVGKIQSTIFH